MEKRIYGIVSGLVFLVAILILTIIDKTSDLLKITCFFYIMMLEFRISEIN